MLASGYVHFIHLSNKEKNNFMHQVSSDGFNATWHWSGLMGRSALAAAATLMCVISPPARLSKLACVHVCLKDFWELHKLSHALQSFIFQIKVLTMMLNPSAFMYLSTDKEREDQFVLSLMKRIMWFIQKRFHTLNLHNNTSSWI